MFPLLSIEIKKTPIGDEKFLAVMKSYNFALRLKQKKPRQGTIIKIIRKGREKEFYRNSEIIAEVQQVHGTLIGGM